MNCERCNREARPLELAGEKLVCADCFAVLALQVRKPVPFRSRKPAQMAYREAHLEEVRQADRARYRSTKGIPLDAPLAAQGRPKKGDPPRPSRQDYMREYNRIRHHRQRDERRLRDRNKYRQSRGIPLDAPLLKPGRPRKNVSDR